MAEISKIKVRDKEYNINLSSDTILNLNTSNINNLTVSNLTLNNN